MAVIVSPFLRLFRNLLASLGRPWLIHELRGWEKKKHLLVYTCTSCFVSLYLRLSFANHKVMYLLFCEMNIWPRRFRTKEGDKAGSNQTPIQIHQSAYRDQTNIPVRSRVVVLKCKRARYADWWIWIDAHTSNAFGWDFCTGHVEKAGLATSGLLSSRNFGRTEPSFGWSMDTYLVDREPVFSR